MGNRARKLDMVPEKMTDANKIRTRFAQLCRLAGTRRVNVNEIAESIYQELLSQHEFAFKYVTVKDGCIFGFAWLITDTEIECPRISCRNKISGVYEIKICAMRLVGEELRAAFKDEGIITGIRNSLLKNYPQAPIVWSDYNSLQGRLIQHSSVQCGKCGFSPRPLK